MQQQNSNIDISSLLALLQGGGNNTGGNLGSFGFNAGTLDTLGTGAGIISDIAGLYFGNKQLSQAEDQFKTNTAFGNRNLSNQARVVNNTLEARYRAALAAQGKDANSGAGKESLDSYLARSKVDGSPVGGG